MMWRQVNGRWETIYGRRYITLQRAKDGRYILKSPEAEIEADSIEEMLIALIDILEDFYELAEKWEAVMEELSAMEKLEMEGERLKKTADSRGGRRTSDLIPSLRDVIAFLTGNRTSYPG